MQFKIPKNNEKYYWTKHSLEKMKYYGLTGQRVLRVIRAPQRIEKGIVKNTIAVMQPPSYKTKNGKKIWTQEIWAMYQIKSPESKVGSQNAMLNSKSYNLKASKLKIISAWRYPGVSPKNNPIPKEIIDEMLEAALVE